MFLREQGVSFSNINLTRKKQGKKTKHIKLVYYNERGINFTKKMLKFLSTNIE